LSKHLWAHRKSRHGTIKVIPFELVYELEVVLLAEVNLDVSRLAKKSDFPLLIIIIY